MIKLIYILLFTISINAQITVDISDFGAISSNDFLNRKIPFVKASMIFNMDASRAINDAIAYIKNNGGKGTIVINGDYLINPIGLNPKKDIAIDIPNGISLVVNGSLHSNYNGINIRKKSYNSNDRIVIYHKLWKKMTKMAEWYVKAGEKEPFDKYSVGIQYVNSRHNTAFIEVQGFNKGLEILGDGDGSSSNIFTLGKMFNNRIDIDCGGVNRGWCNENIFIGGKFWFYGYINRDKSRRVESSLIRVDGNGNRFYGLNFENNKYKKYTILDFQGNNFYDVRLESSMYAETIYFKKLGSILYGGIHYNPRAIGKYNEYNNRKGLEYVQNNVRQSLSYGRGQLKLSAFENTLELQSENGYFLIMSRDGKRGKHIFNSDGSIEFNTSKNGFLNHKSGYIYFKNGVIYAKDFKKIK